MLEDQGTVRVGEAVQNISGVSNLGQYQGYEDLTYIRGFQVSTFQGSYFRDGVRTFTFGSPNTTNLERIEVLKGPAAVLFGQVEPGGIINLVTKQPLPEPYYAGRFSIGNFNTYESSLDLSSPLNDQTGLFQIQTGEVTSKGIEFDVSGEILPGWNIIASTSVSNQKKDVEQTFS